MPKLVPVDNDPFASSSSQSSDSEQAQPKLIPVDNDPFSESFNNNITASMPDAKPSSPVYGPSAVNKPPSIPQQSPQRPPVQTQPAQLGFMDRVQQDWRNKVGESQKMDANPAPTGVEDALQRTGKLGASFVNDVAGEAAKSVYGMLPEGVKEKVSGGLKMVMDSPAGKMGLQMAQKGAGVYQKWAEQNPRIAKDLESVVDIASAIPTGMGAGKAAIKAAPVAAEASLLPTAGRIAKGVMSPSNERMAAITDTMHKKATQTIENAKNAGVVFDIPSSNNLTKRLDALPDFKTAGERSNVPKTIQAVDNLKESISNGDTSMRNLLGFRQTLKDIKDSGGADGTAASRAMKELDEHLSTGNVIAGNPKDTQLAKQFRGQWQRYKTGEDVVDATKLADENPKKSQRAFQKLMDSEGFSTLSPEVRRLVQQAAKGKTSGNILGAIGSIKSLMGASMGKHIPAMEASAALLSGHPAVAAAIGGVVGASAGSKQIQRGVGSDILKQLLSEQ